MIRCPKSLAACRRCRPARPLAAWIGLVAGFFLVVAGHRVGAEQQADALPASPAVEQTATLVAPAGRELPITMPVFLDRLMLAESGGRDRARNPRSTALGPYQFIQATFLDLARRHFADATATLTPAEILSLRTDRAFARRAAEAYTNDNAALLAAQGIRPTFPLLRLAFLVGPASASAIVRAPGATRLVQLMRPAVLRANPFMARMTAADLIAKSARDLEISPTSQAAVIPRPDKAPAPRLPQVNVQCNLQLPACRRWVVLQERKLGLPATSLAGR
jgi:hypothetical protein